MDVKGKYTKLVNDKCGSLWFQRFMTGCQNRMGATWKPNMAMSIKLLLNVLAKAEERAMESDNFGDKHM